MEFEAIIFDLDGVILDSEGLHAEAKRITLNHFKIGFDESILSDFKGRPDTAFFAYVSCVLAEGKWSAMELDNFKYNAYRKISSRIKTIPGALEFISICSKKFKKMGLVTSARKRDLEIADKMHGFKKWFDVIILGDHTKKHKPHQEPYLMALEKLGTTPQRTVVIEDSPNGILAASGCGCYTIGITTNFSPDLLLHSGASSTADSFGEIAAILKTEGPPG